MGAEIPSEDERKGDFGASATGGALGGMGGARMVLGGYNPEDYASLSVPKEIKEVFSLIQEYQPVNLDIPVKVKAFIPDYIATIGEVDAFLKIPRPDKKAETLGLTVLVSLMKSEKRDCVFCDF